MAQSELIQYSLFSDLDFYLFGEGKHYQIYEKLGAHPVEFEGVTGTYFALWAPKAVAISVVGDFNDWKLDHHPMKRNQMGIWELFIPSVSIGEKYKFAIKNHQQHSIFKTDPYGYQQELRPATASIVTDLSYDWGDRDWLNHRHHSNPHTQPISVYEVHLGSWLHQSWETPPENGVAVSVPHKPGARFLTYRELADKLIPYVKKMGYTHIELLPITEHPFDGSWGYQVVGYFAPTSRYGTPQDFMYFVDQCHQNNIGVILDWVPGHFPKDEHGLALFDGTHLYEYADPRMGEHKGWGTLVFNYSRHEVRNFLISSAVFWFDKYHIDGIRVDAVASMLYLDYEREPGQWMTNPYGGRENLDAVEFLRQLNHAIFNYYPGVLSIAEESTTWEGVSRPVDAGGLGFNFKWNMGWMNDTLRVFQVNSSDRSNVYNTITFSIWYAFTENFMLALSHDEVVHGKGHLFQKIPGDHPHKLANLRLLFAYMFTHPGKKTLFMGMELGQTREWNVNGDLDWWLLEQDPHQKLQQLVQYLNYLYQNEPALYSDDFTNDGFEWIDCHDHARGLISYLRKDKYSGETIITVCNFKPNAYHNYWVGVRHPGTYIQLLNTDSQVYGGNGLENPLKIQTRQWNSHPWPYALEVNVPPVSCCAFKLGIMSY
ncbi:1,4-alpha-glucan branching enzyme [Gloeothece citriformis PCC 7424]|uniref:1,4-alpha-glucan branching enzyme GlgB n=1 Tax=Gloeothece citriformis (strain PCC 7424) TaxID=65393 RepID=B7K8V9_GLOC7|nr:1,4-alpha-glucan branching protein GlgB [Gloeothece citriformis]ACK72728.1 1,4-alpha-glucan branching enzyme [Gloeothece citriformis PCC 7424]